MLAYLRNSVLLLMLLIAVPGWSRTLDVDVSYQLTWDGFTIAYITDELSLFDEQYTINSTLMPRSWLEVFGIPSLERAVNGRITNDGQLQPSSYYQSFGARQTEILFNHASSQISWVDSKHGIFSTDIPPGQTSDALSVMYLFYNRGPPPETFAVNFVDGKRLRTYEFQSDLTPQDITTETGSYTAFEYTCTTKPITIWYAAELNWIPLKMQIKQALQTFEITFTSASFIPSPEPSDS